MMRFAAPLIPATLVRRYKRFLADVVLPGGEEITAHVANPGAMTGLATPGARVFLSQVRQGEPQAALFMGAGRGRPRLRAGTRRRQHRASQC